MPIKGIEFRRESDGAWVTAAERDPADEDGLRLLGTPKGTQTFLYADVPGSSWNASRLANAQAWVQQNLLDIRIPRDSLDPDHPYVSGGDPALEWLFWDGVDVVERLVVIEGLTFENGQLDFTLRRIKR